MSRILILGKDGMLGHDLRKAFAGEDFVALGTQDLDITQKDAVFACLMSIQPDIVINAAGYTDVDGSETESEKADLVNGYAAGIVAKASREIAATLVHFSTDYVFDGEKPEGYREEDKTSPINAYGNSKELGEKLVLEEMEYEAYPNQPAGKYFLIRTSWLFGLHGDNFVNKMLKLAQKQQQKRKLEKKIDVVSDQFGKPTYALDLAQQVKWLVESKEYPSGIYHITNEGATSWYEFAGRIFDLKKLPIDVVPCSSATYAARAKRPAYSSLINTKLPPLRSWQEALQEYLASGDNG